MADDRTRRIKQIMDEELEAFGVTLDAREACEALGVEERTLRRWITAGKLRARKTSPGQGGKYRFAKRAVAERIWVMEV